MKSCGRSSFRLHTLQDAHQQASTTCHGDFTRDTFTLCKDVQSHMAKQLRWPNRVHWKGINCFRFCCVMSTKLKRHLEIGGMNRIGRLHRSRWHLADWATDAAAPVAKWWSEAQKKWENDGRTWISGENNIYQYLGLSENSVPLHPRVNDHDPY